MLELLPSPPSIIPPPINLFVWLRPLCCGGQRVWPEYFEVDSCSTHTCLHLTAILRKSLKEYTNGLSRCENVIDWIILSSSLPHRYKVRAQAFRVCACVCQSALVCVCFCPLYSRCVFCHNTKSCWLWFTMGSLPRVSRSWRQDLMESEASDQPQWNKNQSRSLWALIRLLELFWNIPAYESLCLPDWKHPSRTDLYSFFLLMLSTIHKLRRESVLSLKFDKRPNETNLVWRLKFNV